MLKVLLNKCGRYNPQASLLFTIFVDVTEEGDLIGRCLEIEAVGRGRTLLELRRNMADAISLPQVSRHEEGVPHSNISIKDSITRAAITANPQSRCGRRIQLV